MTRWRTAAALAAVVMFVTACGNAPDEGGGISVDGSSTVAPLTDAIAEEYAQVAPDVTVNLAVSGTGGGFERFCGVGDIDISNASRPIKDEEAQRCADNGISYIEVRVGTDALTMVTNPDTAFLDCLTAEEIRAFWVTPGADTWDQVDPGFPSEQIAIFAPDSDSGTYDFLNETVLESDDQEVIQDYNSASDDNVIAQGVIGTPGGWGFFGFAYFQENQERLEAIAYDAGDGCVEPGVETAQDDSYKLARPLFIYVDEASLWDEEHVADFVRFYLDNVGDVIADVGYIPASDDVIEQAKRKVEDW